MTTSVLLAAMANASGQNDPVVLGAILVELKEMQFREQANGVWIRDGVFDISRHNVRYSFRESIREWTESEKEQLESTADRIELPLRFCKEDCEERPHTAWAVSIGEAKRVSDDEVSIPVQTDAGGVGRSWHTSHEMVVSRSPEGGWVVTEVKPGTHSDAISCEILYGHSCEEQIEREEREAPGDG